MSTPSKTSRLGRGIYQRPSADVLDDLTNPGTSGNFDTKEVSGTVVTQEPSVTSGSSVTVGTVSNEGYSGARGTSGITDVSRSSKTSASPRDHVKVARPLVNEMRDAVWFMSEHGRPRVQLGELLDEAISTWLKAAKEEHNEGEPFPVRGPLR